MASRKRARDPAEDGDDGERSRRLKQWRPLILEVMGERFFRRLLMALELLFRTVVQEEVRNSLVNYESAAPRRYCRLLSQEVEVRYQLQFQNELPDKLYTMDKIMTKDKNHVQISIFDTTTQTIVTSGPFSSVKIKVLVLHGDFHGDGYERWTKEEFDNHIVIEREGRGPLLTGKLNIQLRNGVGYLDDIAFSDNSVWTRSKKFRLAVRIDGTGGAQEGMSEPIRVKDRRGKSNEKHHPPLLTDAVWYLDKIRKGGPFHRRLEGAGILNVQHFLQELSIDHDNLHSLLFYGESSKNGNSNRTWQAIVQNAMECLPVPLSQFYSYDVVGQSVTLFFNSVFELLGAKVNGHYHSISNLNGHIKAFIEGLKKNAFENRNDFKLHHKMVSDIPVSVPQEFNHLVTGSSLLGSQHQLSSDEASGRVVSQLEDTFGQKGVHPATQSTLYHETYNSNMIPASAFSASFRRSNAVDLGNLHVTDFSNKYADESTRDWGIPHQTFSSAHELPRYQIELEDNTRGRDTYSVQEKSSQMQVVQNENNYTPVSSSSMLTPKADGTTLLRASLPDMQIPGYRAIEDEHSFQNIFEQEFMHSEAIGFFQSTYNRGDIVDEQEFMHSEAIGFFQSTYNRGDIVDEHMYQNEMSGGGFVGHLLKEDEVNEFILEMESSQPYSMTIVATSAGKWFRLISGLKVWIRRYLAAKRAIQRVGLSE
ncbi:calmodulin-binding protein 60 A-like [Canna indica]|uniref:Calmodulin-binding protein 60 A-like n=1 Tax=Canna indica TaxID=4628 RepID=A0AAQ3K7M3_9LILI|nr:calmodulin-binding protein 60 A-like [Canna indica]